MTIFDVGIPTVHRKFDEATAILVGDGLLTFAFEVLSDAETHASAVCAREACRCTGTCCW